MYFSFSSWLIITGLIFAGIPKHCAWENQKDTYEKTHKPESLQVIVKNPDAQQPEKMPDQGYISDENRQASGALTKNPGFEYLSPYRDLTFAQQQKRKQLELLQSKYSTRPLQIQFTKLGDIELWGHQKGNSNLTRIPDNYKFRQENALSFNSAGLPVIPTIYDKHADYFKKMIDKIQGHWAPPGGNPYPVYGDTYHSLNTGYIPGTTSFQSYPTQVVYTLIMLDRQGNVVDTRVTSSKGYESLNESCLDAIRHSKNFGPPPEELLQDGFLIIPFAFRFIN